MRSGSSIRPLLLFGACFILFRLFSCLTVCRYDYRKMNEELLVVQLRPPNSATVELQKLVGEEAEKIF